MNVMNELWMYWMNDVINECVNEFLMYVMNEWWL